MHPQLRQWQDQGLVPHYFGLGFIQLKLDTRRRVHFWVPDWPTIPGAETELHGHRYDFVSTVLLGRLVHELFVLGPVHAEGAPDDLEVIEVACTPGEVDDPRILGYAAALPVGTFTVVRGEQYELAHRTLHRAHSVGPTITYLTRDPQVVMQATVARPQGTGFTCPFSLPVDAQACWARMDAMACAHEGMLPVPEDQE